MDDNVLAQVAASSPGIRRARVVDASGDRVTVGFEGLTIPCDVVDALERVALQPGDEVIVWTDASAPENAAVVIGRIQRNSRAASIPAEETEMPDTLLLEARRSLTLRVGEGSITIQADGKILIKGKDLVSHAQRMNRIKGGSVSIN